MKKAIVITDETTIEREARTGVSLRGFGLIVAGSMPANPAMRSEWAQAMLDLLQEMQEKLTAMGTDIVFQHAAVRIEDDKP